MYECHCGDVHNSAERGPCPQVWAFPIAPALRACDHCGDTLLRSDGTCPVCSQQVTYTIDKRTFPLAILRGPLVTANAPGFYFRTKRCAVVDQSDQYPYGEYLTACGDVVLKGHSVSSQRPDCPACRKALRSGAAP